MLDVTTALLSLAGELDYCSRPLINALLAEMVLLVSVPQILLYTVGLPLAATVLLYRRRDRLGDKRVQFRWGLLYAGFRHKVWW